MKGIDAARSLANSAVPVFGGDAGVSGSMQCERLKGEGARGTVGAS